MNPAGFRCLRFADIGGPKAWYCGFHYWVKHGRFQPVMRDLVEFVKTTDPALYCCVETHHSAEYLWALCNGETVARETSHPCMSCREGYGDAVGQWRGVVGPPAWIGRYRPTDAEFSHLQQALTQVGGPEGATP